VLGAHAAAVLLGVMAVRLHLLRLHMLCVELQDLRGVVINGNDGVEQGHGKGPRGVSGG